MTNAIATEHIWCSPAAPLAGPADPAEAETKVGVTALVHDDAGRVLLGLKGRAFDPAFVAKWVTPGGRVNYGETLAEAVVREVQEETGLIVSVLRALPPQEIIHARGHYVFFAFECAPALGTLCAGDDLTEVRWCDAAELSALREAMTPITQRTVDEWRAVADPEALRGALRMASGETPSDSSEREAR